MEQNVLHNPTQQLTPENGVRKANGQRLQADHSSLFIALGMQRQDPGYELVAETVQSLGKATQFHEALWHVNAAYSIDKAFKEVNKSMLDRRIDGETGLLMIDPNNLRAKWYLSLEVSAILNACWLQRANLFISFNSHEARVTESRIVRDIQALGTWAPISKSIWYVSSVYSSKDAFQILTGSLETGDRLIVFDAAGNIAFWDNEPGRMSVQLPHQDDTRPDRASIHSSNTWQESALAEFL